MQPHFGPKGNFEDGHFGRSTGLVDFMGYSACESRCTPIISALPTTTSSTSSNTFDMTQLKMEMSSKILSIQCLYFTLLSLVHQRLLAPK